MPVTSVPNANGANDRNRWTIFEPGKPGATYADTEVEAQAEAAKIPSAIVMPPMSRAGSGFTATTTAPTAPVTITTPPMPGAPPPSGNRNTIGSIAVTAQAMSGGVRITVNSKHVSVGDKMNYVLQLRMNGTYYPVKQLLAGEVVNPASYESTKTFDINYAELDKAFADHGHPELKIVKGAEFAVLAAFPSGHQWGLQGWNRGTEFVAPDALP